MRCMEGRDETPSAIREGLMFSAFTGLSMLVLLVLPTQDRSCGCVVLFSSTAEMEDMWRPNRKCEFNTQMDFRSYY